MPKIRPLLKEGGEWAIVLLEAVSKVADACPPLKIAADSVLVIANTAKGFQENKEEWHSFANWVEQCIACVVVAMSDLSMPSDALDARSRAFHAQLVELGK